MKKTSPYLLLIIFMVFCYVPAYASTATIKLAVGDQIDLDAVSNAKTYSWSIESGSSSVSILSGADSRYCTIKCTNTGTANLICKYTYLRTPLSAKFEIQVSDTAVKSVVGQVNVGSISGFRHYASGSPSFNYNWEIISGNDCIAMWDGSGAPGEVSSCTSDYCAYKGKKAGTAQLRCIAVARDKSYNTIPNCRYIFTATINVIGSAASNASGSSSSSSSSDSSASSSRGKKVKVKSCSGSASVSKIKKKASTVKKGKSSIIMSGKTGFVKYTAKKTGTHEVMLAFMSSKKLSATGFATIGTISGGKRKLMKFNLRGGYNNRQFFKLCTERYWESHGTYYYSGDEYFPQQLAKVKMKKGQTYYIYLCFHKGDVISLKIS